MAIYRIFFGNPIGPVAVSLLTISAVLLVLGLLFAYRHYDPLGVNELAPPLTLWSDKVERCFLEVYDDVPLSAIAIVHDGIGDGANHQLALSRAANRLRMRYCKAYFSQSMSYRIHSDGQFVRRRLPIEWVVIMIPSGASPRADKSLRSNRRVERMNVYVFDSDVFFGDLPVEDVLQLSLAFQDFYITRPVDLESGGSANGSPLALLSLTMKQLVGDGPAPSSDKPSQ